MHFWEEWVGDGCFGVVWLECFVCMGIFDTEDTVSEGIFYVLNAEVCFWSVVRRRILPQAGGPVGIT